MNNEILKGSLKYSAETIEKIKNEMNFEKAPMLGFYENLLKLKTDIEKFYDENVFYLGYSLDDAPYHGWDGEHLKGMSEIDREICKRFYEIYAIILGGIGE